MGKTSVALGMVRALRRRGLSVQPFKIGPDFLDPSYLQIAAGRTCYNLDPWMCGPDYVRQLFARVTDDAEMAVIEGVMGMYDGASPESSAGSTAAVAKLLDAPVILIANAGGLARSFAAIVQGFANFESEPHMVGAIANRVGSERHTDMLRRALASTNTPALVGALPKQSLPNLPDRHLGLVTANDNILPDDVVDGFAAACEQHLDLDRILDLARNTPDLTTHHRRPPARGARMRLAIARDRAFHFYYPDNLEMLEWLGATLVPFSPVDDESMPDADALYLGGGYPEEYARALSNNGSMRESVRDFCNSGGQVYAECGGLMYLSRSLKATGGEEFPMCNVLPTDVRMLDQRRALGYTEVSLQRDCIIGPAGTTIRGHEFHYSELMSDPTDDDNWSTAYSLHKRSSGTPQSEGYTNGNVLASYVHLHLASRPLTLKHWVDGV